MYEQSQESKHTTTAEQLGLVDGEFLVRRSDGSAESGWGVSEVMDDEMGNAGGLVRIEKIIYNEDGQPSGRLEKDVYTTRLMEWNTPRDDASYSPEIIPSVERQRLLFSPIEQEDSPQEAQFDFSHLLDPDSESSVDYAAVRPEGSPRGRVTQESHDDAVASLREMALSDHLLSEIIARYKTQDKEGVAYGMDDLPELLRKDEALRLLVGEYLLRKIDQMAVNLPPRVRKNEQKSAGTAGYEHIPTLKSREYVALLALSMLDGTFRGDKADTETYNPNTEKGVGQHRYAARQILFTRDIARVV